MAVQSFGAIVAALWMMIGLVPAASAKPLDIEDVLATVSIDKVDPSPDGKDIAVTIQRPASDGEVFGRTAYEIDPSRTDVWLVARDGSARRNLTQGAAQAAGFWCAQWSPDGRRLAMLSTKPEGKEPRGGDSVRLYVWEREGGRLKRLSDRPMMTQTRYGSPMNALDLRLSGEGQNSKVCRRWDENAPFLWLDARRLLVVQMPAGQNSSLFTQARRPAERSAQVAEQLRGGREPTVDVSDSDRTALTSEVGRYVAEVAVIDVESGTRRSIGQAPAFPFRGTLSLVVAPDGRQLAVAAASGAIAPHLLGPTPSIYDDAQTEKKLGVMRLDGSASPRWFGLPPEARYLLDPLGWSPDSARLVFRARRAASDSAARFFAVDGANGQVTAVAPGLASDFSDVGFIPHQAAALWQGNDAILVRGRAEGHAVDARESWWRIEGAGAPQAHGTPPLADPRDPAVPSDALVFRRDA